MGRELVLSTEDWKRILGQLRAALGLGEKDTPFPWQEELLRRFIAGNIPRALDIPTGLGKTSVMAIWLVARAAGADVPRRLVYVVDRRAVVDQATEVAEQLRDFTALTPQFTQALGLLRPLPISTLRGQFIDNKEWLEDPASPAIVLGTVDMVGSRLLFSGYGVSRKMRPYHAGFLGADSLIVLDEAHLVPPFERLVEQLATQYDAHGRPLGPEDPALQKLMSLRCLSLSATGRERQSDETLRLSASDQTHSIVRKRLAAPKSLQLKEEVSDKELPDTLAAEAWALSEKGTQPVRLIVFCTSRDHAQKVQEALRTLSAKSTPIDTELFVGGRRVYEREEAALWLSSRGFIAGSKARPERATFVVSTAAGEVGVDLDADHAVCDLVAWERMVQRFGRVNRRGDGNATINVVPVKTDDPAQTAQRNAVLELLGSLPQSKNGGAIDVSPGALAALKETRGIHVLIERASSPAPLHPPLTRAVLEAWSMTSLEEHTGRPNVAPWLRGWPDQEEDLQTTVVWRTYLPSTDRGELLSQRNLEAFRSAADPHLAEKLETETKRVVEWLTKRIKTLRDLQPEDAESDRFERPLRTKDVIGVILDSRDSNARLVSVDDLSSRRDNRDDFTRALQGATLILDRRVGGLRSGLLADDADDHVMDVTELEPSVDESAKNAPTRIVPFRVRRVVDDEDVAPIGWRAEACVPIRSGEDGDLEWFIIESLVGTAAESEEGRSGAKRAQLLDEHQRWAEDEAKRIGSRLGLSGDYDEVLTLAARLHDEGKQALCWQRAFHAPSDGCPPFYAKTTRSPNQKILGGYRHELGSLPYAEADPRVQALAPELRELCLHLVAAHHGFARPLISTTGAPEPPTRLIERAQTIALRFAKLEQTWGPWGLAYWEALLRAADQKASRRNDEAGDSRG